MTETLVDRNGSHPLVCPKCGGETLREGECFACAAPEATIPQLASEALQGLPGDFVRLMAPVSEAHPAALLFEFLTAFGCCVGGGPTLDISGNLQPARLFTTIVGESSRARKSSARHRVRPLFDAVDPAFAARWFGAPSTAEGLLDLVRDPEYDDQGRVKWGSADRRALMAMPELARLLRAMERSGQTMSALLREAFDVGTLRIIRRVDPLTATDPHICLMANVTGFELFGLMSSVELWNGFANRFCYVLATRTIKLPFGGEVDKAGWNHLAKCLREILGEARRAGTIRWGSARELWPAMYDELTEDADGLLGAILARADTQVLRLAITYALCDGTNVLGAGHLEAARAAWGYCEATVRFMYERWGTGTATAEGLHRASIKRAEQRVSQLLWARRAGETITRSEAHRRFSGNVPMAELEQIMRHLVAAGHYAEADVPPGPQGGRPAKGWRRT